MEALLVWSVTVPIMLLLLGVAGMLIFRTPIARLIPKTRRAGKDGIEFEQQTEGAAAAARSLNYDDLMRQPVSATVQDFQARLSSDLEEFKPKDDKQRIAMLLRLLALSMINAQFSQIHSQVFGSQMELLLSLVSRQTPLPLDSVQAVFEAARQQHPEFYKGATFENWIGFLKGAGLVAEHTGAIDLTQRGKDFMKFLVDTRGATPRPG